MQLTCKLCYGDDYLTVMITYFSVLTCTSHWIVGWFFGDPWFYRMGVIGVVC